MSEIDYFKRQNGQAPYEDYLKEVSRSGRKEDEAKIKTYVARLAELGSSGLAVNESAKYLRGDIWELRPGAHRISYFWDAEGQRYVLLHGFRKTTQQTPDREIERAEDLRRQYLNQQRQ